MPIKTESELSENARTLWLKAMSAFEVRNYGYVITLMGAVIKEEPMFFAGRQMLRKAEIANSKGKKGGGFFGLDTGSLSFGGSKLGGKVSKDPEAAMIAAEKVMESDPFNLQANLALRDAAMALDLPELATFALETLVEGHPKDTKILHELGRHLTNLGMHERAIKVYNRIVDINPNDLEASKMSKDSSARASISNEGWDSSEGGDTDYRRLIKNKDQAALLEQQNRVVKSADVIEQQLGELYGRLEEEPENVDLARRIGILCEQKEDFDSAYTYYEYALGLTGNTDAGLERKMAECQIRALDTKIKALSLKLQDSEDAETRQQLDEFKAQRAERLLADAKARVERNPTDLTLRFELGELLVEAGQYGDAIPELQKARTSPNARVRATKLLAQCFEARGIHDIAVSMYEEAAKELHAMDATKKDLLYRKALLHEKMGDQGQYLDSLKKIYEADYSYLDVAQRVEGNRTAG